MIKTAGMMAKANLTKNVTIDPNDMWMSVTTTRIAEVSVAAAAIDCGGLANSTGAGGGFASTGAVTTTGFTTGSTKTSVV